MSLAVALTALVTACTEPATTTDDHMADSSIPALDIQGHRGCRGLLPENSIPAFIHALQLGVTTLELDVVISRDSQVLVSHEPWLSSTICQTPAGELVQEGSERTWNMYQMNYEEIRSCDCGSRPHPRFPDQQSMPTYKPLLSEVIDSVQAYLAANNLPQVYYNIETKCQPEGDNIFHPEPEAFTKFLLDVIITKGIKGYAMIQSFDPRTLQVAHRLDPDLPLVLLVEDKQDPQAKIDSLGFVPQVYSPAMELVNEQLRTWSQQLHMKLIPWTVNDTADMQRMIDFGVDGIITDYPDRLLALRKK